MFLKDKTLNISLTANDIFRTRTIAATSYGIKIARTVSTYYDHQRIGLTLSYRFNATNSKYKGTGAGQSEKQRL